MENVLLRKVVNMDNRLNKFDIDILDKSGLSHTDRVHCIKVAEKALEISRRIDDEINIELVGRGALFHDLGKAKTHEIDHGKIGAEIGKRIGLPQEITDIMEKHIRGGLTAPEARDLGLPVKDYTLNRLEEKIVIYADRLIDIINDGIVILQSESESEERFEEILKTYPKYGKNEITLNRYLGYHREIQGLMKSRIMRASNE